MGAYKVIRRHNSHQRRRGDGENVRTILQQREGRLTGYAALGEEGLLADKQLLVDTDRILAAALAIVHIDRAVVGHLHTVAAGKAPHPLQGRSKTYPPE